MNRFLRSRVATLLLAVAGWCLGSGCVPPEMMLRNTPDSRGPVKIAAIVPLSGVNRPLGMQMLEGLNFAVDELNSQRGINGREVELLVFDNNSSREGAAQAVHSAVEAGAVGLIAGYDSNEVLGIVPLVSQLRLPTVIPLATIDSLTDYGPFVFRNSYTNVQQAASLAAYLWYWRKLLRVSVLIDSTDRTEYSQTLARDFGQAFTDLGGSVMKFQDFDPENPEPALHEVMRTGPQAIMIPSEAVISAKLIKRLRNLGYKGILCGPDTWDSNEFFSELDTFSPGDCVYTAFFTVENDSPEFRNFRKEFAQRNFCTPGSCETQSYDALKLLAIGLGNASDLYQFTHNWLAIRNYSGAAAVYTMLPDGEIDRTIYINTIRPPGPEGMFPVGRLTHSFQFSKLAEYRNDHGQ